MKGEIGEETNADAGVCVRGAVAGLEDDGMEGDGRKRAIPRDIVQFRLLEGEAGCHSLTPRIGRGYRKHETEWVGVHGGVSKTTGWGTLKRKHTINCAKIMKNK